MENSGNFRGFCLAQISSPWCWKICQHKNPIFMAQLGKYSSSMEHLGRFFPHFFVISDHCPMILRGISPKVELRHSQDHPTLCLLRGLLVERQQTVDRCLHQSLILKRRGRSAFAWGSAGKQPFLNQPLAILPNVTTGGFLKCESPKSPWAWILK